MDTRSLLDQLLKSGTDFLQNKNTDSTASTQGDTSQKSTSLGSLLSDNKGGLLAGGVLGLLLGSKTGRKVGGKVLTYGSLAALGTVAYKAYNNWQAQQNHSSTAAAAPAATPLSALPAQEAEKHSRAVLCAMIGAAKADGHIDENERRLIDQGIASLTNDSELQRWFDQELHKPLNPVEIARHASSPEMAAEMYLASLLIVDEDSFMEKAYLDELARQLQFDPSLKAELEAQAKQAV